MDLVPIATEKVSSIRSNTICCISVESVEEYSEGKIQLLRLNITSLAPSRNAVFNHQTGIDFVTEISFCKTPVVNEKRLVFGG